VKRSLTQRIDLPANLVQQVALQTHDIVRACLIREPFDKVIDAIALGCYLQGALDAVQLIDQRPDFPGQLKAIRAAAPEPPR
jgi:hypothetical protein